MSCEQSSVPEKHQEAFSKRLAVYGLSMDSLHGNELRVTRDSMLTLSMSGATHAQPRILRTTDLDVVKRWVGVDDRVAERHARHVCIPPLRGGGSAGHAQVGGATEKDRLKQEREQRGAAAYTQDAGAAQAEAKAAGGVAREQLEAVHVAARAYVRGYSKAVPPEYKKAVEAVYKEFLIPIWAYSRIVVETGSVLQLGTGSNVLAAWEIEVQGSGTIRSRGHLTVDCRNLRHSKLIIANPGAIAALAI